MESINTGDENKTEPVNADDYLTRLCKLEQTMNELGTTKLVVMLCKEKWR